jgi:hypothetical protein
MLVALVLVALACMAPQPAYAGCDEPLWGAHDIWQDNIKFYKYLGQPGQFEAITRASPGDTIVVVANIRSSQATGWPNVGKTLGTHTTLQIHNASGSVPAGFTQIGQDSRLPHLLTPQEVMQDAYTMWTVGEAAVGQTGLKIGTWQEGNDQYCWGGTDDVSPAVFSIIPPVYNTTVGGWSGTGGSVYQSQTNIPVSFTVTGSGSFTNINANLSSSCGLEISKVGHPTNGSPPMTFNFTVAVPAGTSVGQCNLTGSFTGTDPYSRSNSEQNNQGSSLNVLNGVQLSFGSLSTRSLASTPQSFDVSVVVSNSGPLQANVSSSGLVFNGSGVTAVPKENNPITIGGNGNGTFYYTVTVAADASLGEHTGTLTVSATNASNGSDVSKNLGVSPGFTVQSPADLAVQTLAPPVVVDKGQLFTGSVTVKNLGQATADLTSTSFVFTGNAMTVQEVQGNPTQILGGETKTFTYSVTVAADAVPGPYSPTFGVLARDDNNGADASDTKLFRRIAVNAVKRTPGLIIGQPDPVHNNPNNPSVNFNTLNQPVGIGKTGHKLVVTDEQNNRALIWNTIPVTVQQAADVVLGQPDGTSNAANSGGGASAQTLNQPKFLSLGGSKLAIADKSNSRVLVWNTFPTANQQAANVVAGQVSFVGTSPYPSGQPTNRNFGGAQGLFTDGTKLLVADGLFNRVMQWNTIPTALTAATLELGQPGFTVSSPNNPVLGSQSLSNPYGLYTDGTRLFVADSANNRVLIWNTPPTSNQQAATVVLGQPDMVSNASNNGGLSEKSLAAPSGVWSDGTRLYVADSGNSRVLVWNTIPTSNQQEADGVLGQPDFASGTENNGGLGALTLRGPSGLYCDGVQLYVSDTGNNRVLGYGLTKDAEAAVLAFSTFTGPATVSQGQEFSATVEVRNTGGATANMSSSTLTFGGSDLTAVASASNPITLAGGTAGTFAYTISTSKTARKISYTPTLAVSATDDYHGHDISKANALSPTLQVVGPAALAVTSVVVSTGTVSQGETGLTVQVTVKNTSAGWTQVLPDSTSPNVTQPAARYFHGVSYAYDAARQRTVVFGGSTGTAYLNDTWEWDGTRWTPVQADTATPGSSQPPQRESASMAGSPQSRTLLFGGSDDNGFFNDTWQWTGTNWTKLQSDSFSPGANQPAQRAGSVMAYDNARQRTVLFGGSGWTGFLNDTWEWNGTTWTRMQADTATPGDSQPSRRTGAVLAYDSVRGRTVLFGGTADGVNTLNDTWEWNGTSWTLKQADTAAPGVNQPTRRVRPGFAFDSVLQRTMLFGGYTSTGGGGYLNDTWEWDGSNWLARLTNTGSPGPNQPSQREAAGLAYDAAQHRIVLFGGRGDLVSRNDTWIYVDPPGDTATPLSCLLQFTGDQNQYVVTPWPGNVTSLGAGGIAVLTFTVNVRPTALVGPRSVGVTVATSDVLSGDPAAVTYVDSTTSWTVLHSPPSLAFGNLNFTGPVSQGQTFTATVVLENTGGTTAAITSTALIFEGTGFTVTPSLLNVTSLAPGISATFSYSVKVDDFALLGARAASLEVLARNAENGTDASRTRTLSPTVRLQVGPLAAALPMQWVLQSPADKPPVRAGHRIAYDSDRDRVVLFGGNGSAGYVQDTWEYDGTSWTEASPNSKPDKLVDFGLAYDSARGRTVLFGGCDGNVYRNDTWEWDGTNWTRLSPDSSPSVRSCLQLAYDSERGRTVLFGGFNGTSVSDETWEWDGTNWTKANPGSRPAARDRYMMAFDSARGRVVLHGGMDGTGTVPVIMNDTWEWDGADWTRTHDGTGLNQRTDTSMAFDAMRGLSIMFGGWDRTNPNYWGTLEYPGTSWTVLDLTPRPSNRRYLAMAYDSARRQVVLFGGDDGDFQQDTWVYAVKPATLAFATFTAPANATQGTTFAASVLVANVGGTPADLTSTALTFDGTGLTAVASNSNPTSIALGVTATFNYVVTVGDFATLGARAATLAVLAKEHYSGLDVSKTEALSAKVTVQLGTESAESRLDWALKSPTTQPSSRYRHAMAFDSARDRVVLFGGQDINNNRFQDTWEWDGTNWLERGPDHKPGVRAGHGLAYDAARQSTVLFGGHDGNFRQDTWLWNGSDWAEVSPTSLPTARAVPAMAYDSVRGRTVLFGGQIDGGNVTNDTWEWDGTNWTQFEPVSKPNVRGGASMAYDAVRERLVLFGGANLDGELYDTWEWDGSNWAPLSPATHPGWRHEASVAYDSALGRVVLFGGAFHNFGQNDTWEWNGTNWTQATPSTHPASAYAAMAYDSAQGRAVLFGGYNPTNSFRETWEYYRVPNVAFVAGATPTLLANGNPTPITLTGSGFTGATAVTLDTVPPTALTNLVVNNDGSLTARIPAGVTPGSYGLSVTTPRGIGAVSTEKVTVVAQGQAYVSGVAPATILNDVATPITLTGIGFTSSTGLRLNDAKQTPLTNVQVLGDGTIIGTLPAGVVAGTYDLVFTKPSGAQTAQGLKLTVSPGVSIVAAATPTLLANGAPTPITLTGSGFTGATAVTLDTEPATLLTNLVVQNDGSLTATVPAQVTPGVYNVKVTTDRGTNTTSTPKLTVVVAGQAYISAVAPASILNSAATPITLTGIGFTGVTGLRLNDPNQTPLTNVQVLNDGTITGTLPIGVRPGAWDVVVLRPGAQTAQGQKLTVSPGISIVSGATPTLLANGNPTPITLTGSGFTGATAVTLDTVPPTALTNVVVNHDGSLTATVPAGATPGTYNVKVTTGRGTNATSTPKLTVVAQGQAYIAGVAPATILNDVATPITLTGIGFAGATGLRLNDPNQTPLTNVQVLDDGTIIGTLPPGIPAGAYDVVVTKPGGEQTAQGLQLNIEPGVSIVAGATPKLLDNGNPTTITLTGSGFTGATAVTLDTVPPTALTNVVVNNDGSLTATVPAHVTPGSYGVSVTTPRGTGAVSADKLTVVPAGQSYISGVAPAPILNDVATPITLSGINFTGATGLRLNDPDQTPLTNVQVLNDGTIIGTLPPGIPAGAYDVVVTKPGGEQTAQGLKLNVEPGVSIVAGATPRLLDNGNPTTITLDGSGFTGATAVTLDTVPPTVLTNVVVNNDGSLTATVPAHVTPGSYGVSVTTPRGTGAVSAEELTIVPAGQAHISGVAPAPILNDVATPITLSGLNFTGATGLRLNDPDQTPLTNVQVLNDGTIIGTLPPGIPAGAYDVVVTKPGGEQTAQGLKLNVEPGVSIVAGATPRLLDNGNPTTITLDGSGFTGATAVTLDTVPPTALTNVVVNSDGSLTATVPAHVTPGSYGVSVTTPRGTGAVSAEELTIVPAGQAHISGVAPAPILNDVATPITLSGLNFTGATGLRLNTVPPTPLTNVQVLDDGTIIGTLPPGIPAGAYDVVVTKPGGEQTAQGLKLNVEPGVSIVAGATPRLLDNGNPTVITLTGSGFTGATAVTLDTVPPTVLTNVVVNNDGSLTATVPAHVTPGSYGVSVTTPRGTGAVSAEELTIVPAGQAHISGVAPAPILNDVATPITLSGLGFTGATGLHLNTVPPTLLTNVQVLDDGTIIGTLPPGIPAGAYDVVVTKPGGEQTAQGLKLNVEPGVSIVAGATPRLLDNGNPTMITLTGSGFTGATAVTLDTTPPTALTNVVVNGDGSLTATVPAHVTPGSYGVSVTTPRGTGAVSAEELTVVPAGSSYIAGMQPSPILNDVATPITLTGINFTGVTGLRLNDPNQTPLTDVRVLDDGTIIGTLPAGIPAGAYDVVVTKPGGAQTAGGEKLTVTPGLALVRGIAPDVVDETPVPITVTGSGFTGATALTLDDANNTPLTHLQVLSDGVIVARVPAGLTRGEYNLRVTTPRGTNSTSGRKLTVVSLAAVSFISPANGATLTEDGSRTAGLQVDVRVRLAAGAGTSVQLQVNSGTPIAATAGVSGEAVFSNVTLPIGQVSTLTATQGSNTVSVQVTVPSSILPHASVRAPGATGGGPRVLELDASESWSPTGQPLQFEWSLVTKPAGAASFSSTLPTTQFDATAPGVYVFEVRIVDPNGQVTSLLTFTVDTVPPVADARGDQQLVLTRPDGVFPFPTSLTLKLDGTASSDPNGQPLTYDWRIVRAPDRSAAQAATTTLVQFSSMTDPRPTLTFSGLRVAPVDGAPMAAAGEYLFLLTVTKGVVSSTDLIQVVAVDPANLAPMADAGLDRSFGLRNDVAIFPDPTVPAAQQSNPANLRTFVRLDGRESADSGGRPLTYRWTVVEAPAGSTVVGLQDAQTAFPYFTPDLAGLYEFQLVVNNGQYDSVPSTVRILIGKVNNPPQALPRIMDTSSLVEHSETDPVCEHLGGSRVRLLGSRSTDSDEADRAALTYLWQQTAGPRVSLEPSTTSPDPTFLAGHQGRLEFQLTVTDPHGASHSAFIECLVKHAALPTVSIVATAPGTSPGEDQLDGLSVTRRHSLRVTSPTTVTLTGTVAGAATGQRFDFLWRQVAGPVVQLSNLAELDSSQVRSVTNFVPTTSRVHIFELTVFPLDAGGLRMGLLLKRRVNVIVDSATVSVPVADGLVTPASILLTGSATARTVTLDGSSSRLVGVLSQSGLPLAYSWRQVSGPRGTIDNPYAVSTFFTAPDFGSDTTQRDYLFELTVDVTPPGDRSEPVYLRVTQGTSAAGVGLPVRVFLDGVPVSLQTTLAGTDLTTMLTLPPGTLGGGTLTLEQVDGSGNRLVPPVILQRCILNLAAGSPNSIVANGDEPVWLSPTAVTGPFVAVFNPPVAMFVNGVSACPPALMVNGQIGVTVTLPPTAATGAILTLERVDRTGVRLNPPLILRTSTLVVTTGGPSTINDTGTGTITVDVSVPGTGILGYFSNLSGGTHYASGGWVGGGGGGGGGCVLDRGGRAAPSADALVLLLPLALIAMRVTRRRRA